jgi:hypothetical protein
VQHLLHPAGQARRPAGRRGAGNLANRTGIYDVRVTVDDVAIAELRGHSRTVGGAWVPATAADAKSK